MKLSRPPQLRLSLERELIIDQFAGGGGASLGIELALGRSPDIAINHDPEAIALHTANHPTTQHHCEDVFKIDPLAVCAGRPVGLMWLSPDCKHFSKAKGGKPVEKKIRGLAWLAVKWARTVRPRVIILENVEEFQDWGPLTAENMPCPKRKGLTFQRWKRELENCGYVVEHRELRACDYGAPTIRKRLFLDRARRDGKIDGYAAAIAALQPMVDRMQTLRTALDEQLGGLIDDLGRWRAKHEATGETTDITRSVIPAPARQASAPRAQPRPRIDRKAGNGAAPIEGISRSQQRILEALAMLEGMRIAQPTRTQLALWADVSPTSGGYFNNLGALRSAGLIDYPAGGTVALTDAGRDRAPTPEAISAAQMQEWLFAKVGNSKGAILRALIDIYPRDITRGALAGKIGVSATSGGYFNNLGALRTLGVIDYPSPGKVVALPVLFLES